MNGLPYYKAYPRDFVEGTINLPFEVKCTYRFVLDLIYMQGGKLPDNARYISGLLGCSMRKWNSIRQALIDAGKLLAENGVLTNYRAVIELETLAKLQDKQRENASGPRKNKDLQKPRLNPSEPEPDIRKREPNGSPKRATRIPDDFVPDEAWALAEGLTLAEIKTESAQFVDFWRSKPGKDGTKQDWPATWRNWVRNSIKRRPPMRSTAPPKPLTQGESIRNMARKMGVIDDTGNPIRRVETSERDGEDPSLGNVIRLAIASDHGWGTG